MNFVAPDVTLMRRSECGQYLIEKIPPCTCAPPSFTLGNCEKCGRRSSAHYVLWRYVRSSHGFMTARDAVEEATSLQDQATQEWERQRKASQAEGACATSAPAPR